MVSLQCYKYSIFAICLLSYCNLLTFDFVCFTEYFSTCTECSTNYKTHTTSENINFFSDFSEMLHHQYFFVTLILGSENL